MQRYIIIVAALAVAITISCIDALSISQTNNIRVLGTSSTTSRVGISSYHGAPIIPSTFQQTNIENKSCPECSK